MEEEGAGCIFFQILPGGGGGGSGYPNDLEPNPAGGGSSGGGMGGVAQKHLWNSTQFFKI